jgi:hypothetical protein
MERDALCAENGEKWEEIENMKREIEVMKKKTREELGKEKGDLRRVQPGRACKVNKSYRV